MILLPMQARAESSDEFLLDGKTGTVTICSQHAGEEALSSLQFSISIDSADADKISFEFGETNAKITEFRYDEETNRLNIYMAGVDPLFAKGGDTLTVGKIVVQDSNGNAVDANVSVVEHSLQYVYGTELKPMDEVDDPGTVLIGPSAVVQPSTPPSTQAPPAEVTPQPEQPGQSDRPQQSDEPQTPPAAQETPDPGSSGTDDDPNAGWNPGWQDPGDNSSGGNNNSTAQTPQGTGGGKKKPTAGKGTGTKVAGAGTTKPSASPAPLVSPSPEPEASEPVTEPESSAEEGNTEEEDIIISTMGSTEETDSEETGSEETKETETKGKTDWLMIVVVIAIVVFVAVGAIAVVVLKGKQKPHNRRG